MDRFVRPDDVVTLPISNGDRLTVRRRLSYGERQDAYARMYTPTTSGEMKVDPFKMPLAMVLAYLVDWTFTREGERWEISPRHLSIEERESALRDLDPDSFDEVKSAINAHEAAQLEARTQEKKLPDGVNGAEVISPSPSAAAGASSGYVS